MEKEILEGIFGEQDKIERFMERYLDKPEEVYKTKDLLKKKLRPLAIALKEMSETPGWKKVFEPFLRNQVNPSKILKLSPDDYGKVAPKLEAYNNILNLFKNISSVLKDEKDEDSL